MMQGLQKKDLLGYAENAVDRRAPVSAAVAAAIAASREAQAESEAMQRTLAFVKSVPQLEPRAGAAQKILQAARRERMAVKRGSSATVALLAARVAGTATVVAAAALLVFSLALIEESNSPSLTPAQSAAAQVNARVQAAQAAAQAAPQPEQEVRTLSALMAQRDPEAPTSILEEQRQRFVRATDMDIRAGQYALERNPGSMRARELVNASLRRQADTLRDLYLEQTM